MDIQSMVEKLKTLGFKKAPHHLNGSIFLFIPEDGEDNSFAKKFFLIIGVKNEERTLLETTAKETGLTLLQYEQVGIGFTPTVFENGKLWEELRQHAIIIERGILEYVKVVHDLSICPCCQKVFNRATKRWEKYSKECLRDFYRDKTVNVIDTYCDECKIQPMLQVI
ncbi:MAG: hypothetical protein WCV41_02205 [Patescibacteria group bacterium]